MTRPIRATARLIALGIVVFLAAASSAASRADEDSTELHAVVTTLTEKWKSEFGPVPFSDENLFNRMVYLHPQPETRFTALGDAKLSVGIQVLHDMWAEQIFRGSLLEQLVEAPPAGYYLNEGKTEPSLLLYRAIVDGSHISLQESASVFFLSVRPALPRSEAGVSAADVEKVLREWTRFDEGGGSYLNFSLRDGMQTGYVFTNNQKRKISHIQDWRDDVVGFVSEKEICLLLFKVDRSIPRSSADLLYDFNWLNGQIEH